MSGHEAPVADPVHAHARRLEAERLRPAPALTPQRQIEADLRQLIALLAGLFNQGNLT